MDFLNWEQTPDETPFYHWYGVAGSPCATHIAAKVAGYDCHVYSASKNCPKDGCPTVIILEYAA